MSKRIDLTGRRIGGWKVVSYAGMNSLGQSEWNCRCECGTTRNVVAQTLRNGKSMSCGCLKPLAIAVARTKHGHSGGGEESRTYRAWKAMHRRCNTMQFPMYRYYKALGIVVCKRWHKFENFLKDMGECPSEIMTLDRIDPYGNYNPSNCRWADYRTQRMNQRAHKHMALCD